jgi:hypothetical protein
LKFSNYGVCQITGEEIMRLGAENISKKLKEDSNQFKASEETKSSSANMKSSPSKDDGSD